MAAEEQKPAPHQRQGSIAPGVWTVVALGAVVEAAASYPWYLFLHYIIDARTTAAVGLGSLLLFALGGALTGLGLERRGATDLASRLATGPGGVLLMLAWLALTPPVWRGSLLVSAAALLWNWSRGLRLAGDEEDHGLALQRVTTAVAAAALALAAGLVFHGWADPSALRTAGLWSGLSLLVAALLLLAVTHQAEVRRGLAARGTPAASHRRFWGGTAVVVIVLVLGIALEGSRLLTGLPPALARTILAPLSWLFEHVLGVVLQLIVLVLGPLVSVIISVMRRMTGTAGPISDLAQNPPPEALQLEPKIAQAVPPLVRIVGMVLLFVVAAVLLARAARRRARARELAEGLVEEHESLWTWSSLTPGSLLDALQALLQRRPGEAAGASPGAREPIGPGWDVRRLYRRFLLLGQDLGHTRQPAETPLRYRQTFAAGLARMAALAPALPGAHPDTAGPPTADPRTAALTEAYQTVRYGDRDPSPTELVELQERLTDLEAEVARLRKNAP